MYDYAILIMPFTIVVMLVVFTVVINNDENFKKVKKMKKNVTILWSINLIAWLSVIWSRAYCMNKGIQWVKEPLDIMFFTLCLSKGALSVLMLTTWFGNSDNEVDK